MGLHNFWQITLVIFSLFTLSFIEASNQHGFEVLGTFILHHANGQVARPHTGIFYNITLPSNISGMEASVVRIRTSSFWARGLNFSFFEIPPRILPNPMVKRMAIVYENLGNWSSYYHGVPNYTLVAPVLGFMAYNSSSTNLMGKEKVNFTISTDPIKILFPKNGLLQGKNETPICAKFGVDGSIEFSNMSEPFVCLTRTLGHYSVVIPAPKVQIQSHRQNSNTMWWVIGFVIGFVVLMLLALGAIAKVRKNTKMRKMEKSSERSEGLNTFWVGRSKMPSASMIRTQPSLEHD